MTKPAQVAFDHLSLEQLDFQFSPSQSAKDAMGTLERHAQATAAILTASHVQAYQDIEYGSGSAQRLDLVIPEGDGPFPCLVFLHGGFWQEGSKAGSGFASATLAEHEWASALVGYTLTPTASLTDIVTEVGRAVELLSQQALKYKIDGSRIIVAGHSAGGHLAAAVICGMAGAAAANAVAGAVLISGVFDLAPVAASYVNDLARLTELEIENLSVINSHPINNVPVHLLVGADETDAFLAHSDVLSTAWSDKSNRITVDKAAGRDHFDVLDELSNPNSGTFKQVMEMVN